jgi:Rrf2 family protein
VLPNRKAEYALRALVDLALHGGGGFVPTSAAARRTGAPAKFLEAILGDLRRAGLVESQRGAAGGHRLARPASAISAGAAWRAVSGPVAGSRRRVPASGAGRAVHELFVRLEAAVAKAADEATVDDLARRAIEADGIADFTI